MYSISCCICQIRSTDNFIYRLFGSPIIFLRERKLFFNLLRKHFLVLLQNYRRSKLPINEIIGIPTLADAKAICIYYYLPNPKLNSEQHRQNLNMRFADFFEFVGTNIVLIFDDSSSVETTHYMSLFHEYFCCSTLFLVGKYH